MKTINKSIRCLTTPSPMSMRGGSIIALTPNAVAPYTNKDCVEAFGFVGRELHFMLREIFRVPHVKEAYRVKDLKNEGPGHHRQLTADEFYLSGLIKHISDVGVSKKQAAKLVFTYLKRGGTVLSFQESDSVSFSQQGTRWKVTFIPSLTKNYERMISVSLVFLNKTIREWAPYTLRAPTTAKNI